MDPHSPGETHANTAAPVDTMGSRETETTDQYEAQQAEPEQAI